jgi:hypothetical protein
MKLRKLALVSIAAALMGFGSVAQAGWTASFNDVLNGVSGTLTDSGFSGGAEHYTLVLNTTGYTGGGSYLDSVDIKAFSDYTSATFTASAGSWVDPAGSGGINNGSDGATGCSGIHGGFACIEANPKGQAALALVPGSTYTFAYNVVGATGLNTTGLDAHVGVGYANAQGLGPYAITSQLTTPVPEPETYAMLLAGLGLMGFVARRRTQNSAAA